MTTSQALDPALLELHEAMDRCTTQPYLLTVTAKNRPHCSVATVTWDDATGRVEASAPHNWPASSAAGLRSVTVLWPPAEPGGYSLIVDGDADCVERGDGVVLSIAVARAVLHRRGMPLADSTTSCGSDCIPILGP